jgi:hypothetical protein
VTGCVGGTLLISSYSRAQGRDEYMCDPRTRTQHLIHHSYASPTPRAGSE